MNLWNILIPALTGMIGVFIGSLKPIIDWNIEKKRLLLEERRSFLKRTRETVSVETFDFYSFIYTAEYAQLRRYLSQDFINRYEIETKEKKKEKTPIHPNTRYTYRHGAQIAILDGLVTLEKQWELL